MKEVEQWAVHINQVANVFSEQMTNMLSQRDEVHFGWVGVTLIANAMHLKMTELKQTKETVIRESLEFLETISSGRNNSLLANVNRHLEKDIFTEGTKDLQGDVSAEMDAVSDLAVSMANTIKVRMVNPDRLDIAVAWFVFGIAAFIKQSKSASKDDQVEAERRGYENLASYINSVPFEDIKTVPIS